MGNGWEREATAGNGGVCLFFLAFGAIFASGPVVCLRKWLIFAGVEVLADGLSACENMFGPLGKGVFLVVYTLKLS
jgi:hypothetical protein